MHSLGQKLLRALLDDAEGIHQLTRGDIRADLFDRTEEREAFEVIAEHAQEYGVLPAVDTHTALAELDDVHAPEPLRFYVRQCEARYLHTGIADAVEQATAGLHERRPVQAFEKLQADIAALAVRRHKRANKIVDFAQDAGDIIRADQQAKTLAGLQYGIQTGWPTLDDMVAGYLPGDFIAVCGRPGEGKTWLLLQQAMHAWRTQRKRVMFVSMEMATRLVVERLAALHTRTPQRLFKRGELGGKAAQHVYDMLDETADLPPFHVIDGNLSAAIEDVQLLAQTLRPDVVYLDGAYMIKNANRGQRKNERIGEVAETAKMTLAGDLGAACVASYQFGRPEKSRARDGSARADRFTIDNIGGSDVIGQVATVVLGLTQAENVATLNRRVIDILKGRSGETGQFTINWLFEQYPYMDFTEIPAESASEAAAPLSYL